MRFPIRFTGINRALWMLGIRRRDAYVELTDESLRVRFAWGFRLDAPRSSVRSAAADHDPVRAWGAHGWRGRWLVNGSSGGLVRIELDPAGRARVLGVRPRVEMLRVSVEDPDRLVVALGGAPG
jgi:hypothetical protein